MRDYDSNNKGDKNLGLQQLVSERRFWVGEVGLVVVRRHKWLLGLICMFVCVLSIWLIAD